MSAADGHSFLILHGWQNRRPPEHWQHWLTERLREEGAQVVYPQLPDPDAPRPEVWLEELRRFLTQLHGEVRVVIAHSLGTLLWLHHARDGGDPVDRVLLVHPPGPSHPRLRSRASSLLSSAPSPSLRGSRIDRDRLFRQRPLLRAGSGRRLREAAAAPLPPDPGRRPHQPRQRLRPLAGGTNLGPNGRVGLRAAWGDTILPWAGVGQGSGEGHRGSGADVLRPAPCAPRMR